MACRAVVVIGAVSLTLIALAACNSFSATDESATDGGAERAPTGDVETAPEAEAPTPDAAVEAGLNPCIGDAGLLYCESFEDISKTTCGVEWKAMNGSAVRVAGNGHGGTGFCRFCTNASTAQLTQTFTFSNHANYVLSAWVRMPTKPDGGAPTNTEQLFVYAADAGEVARSNQIAAVGPQDWVLMQASVSAASGAVSELVGFFPGVYSANQGYCIDIDDVTLAPK